GNVERVAEGASVHLLGHDGPDVQRPSGLGELLPEQLLNGARALPRLARRRLPGLLEVLLEPVLEIFDLVRDILRARAGPQRQEMNLKPSQISCRADADVVERRLDAGNPGG